MFQLATGVANAQYWYPFKFNFVVAHYYGAIVFVASLAIHVIVKLPMVLRAYQDRGWLSRSARTSRNAPEPASEPVPPPRPSRRSPAAA